MIFADFFKAIAPRRTTRPKETQPALSFKPIGFGDFLALDVPLREMLLNPILPERSLAMLYAPRGIGKTLLSLSIGLTVGSGCPLLPAVAVASTTTGAIRRWRNASCLVAGATSIDFDRTWRRDTQREF
jgi:AAA domain